MTTVTKTQLQMFTIGCAWVRMKSCAPTLRKLTSVWKSSYLENGHADEGVAKEAASGIVRLHHCLVGRYVVFGNPTRIVDANDAVNLIAGVWYGSCNKPAKTVPFTDYVQFLFPKIDTLDIAKRAAFVCEEMMPTMYEWWFPGYLEQYEQVEYVSWSGEVTARTKGEFKLIRKGKR